MKSYNTRIVGDSRFLLLIVVMLMTTYAQAIDLSISNPVITPDPITASSTYTISFDITNQDLPTAINPEDAALLSLTINGFDLTNVVSIASNTPSWSCLLVGSIDCDRSFTVSEFSPGNTIPFQMTINTGTSVVNPDTFSITVTDESGLVDDNIADNMASVTTSAGPPAFPDLAFVNGITPATVTFNEGDLAPMMVTYRVTNNGAPVSMDVFLSLIYDDVNFSLTEASVPAGWSCFPSTASLSCNVLNFATNETVDLIFDLAPTFNAGVGSFAAAVTGALSDGLNEEQSATLGDNSISLNVDILPLVTDYEIRVDPILTLPIEVEENTTGNIPVAFQLENVGAAEGLSESVFLSVNPDFELSNVSITNTGNAMWSCNPIAGGWDCIDTATSGGMLPGNIALIDAEISTYPNVVGTTTNAITASVAVSGDNNNLNDTTIVGFNVVPAPLTDLELTKFVKDGPSGANVISDVVIGTDFFYHIHVDNPSSTAATNVTVNDALPAGVQFISDSSSGGWTCLADPFVNNVTPQNVTCTHLMIPANQVSFADTIVLEVVGLTVGNKSNIAFATSTEVDANPANNNNSAGPAIINVLNNDPDIIVNKNISSGVIVGGGGTLEAPENGQVVYQILGINNTVGSDDGMTVDITDTLPTGVTYVSHNVLGPNFTCSTFDTGTNTLSCTAPVLPFSGASDGVEMTVEVTGAVGTLVTNTANISALNDTDSTNNSGASDPFMIVAGALPEVDLSVTKDAQDLGGVSIVEVEQGDSFIYEFMVENTGPSDAPVGSVEITDTLPPEVAFELPLNSPTGWGCNVVGSNGLSCINQVPIEAGGPAFVLDFAVSAQVVNPTVTNTVNVLIVTPSVVQDDNFSNNDSSITIAINNPPTSDLIITKSVVGGASTEQNSGVSEFEVGENVTYLLSVNNNATAVSYSDLVITDALPNNVSFSSVAQNQGFVCNYDAGNHEVTCNNDSNNQLLPGEILDITIETIAATVGVNVINIANASSVAQSDNVNSNDVSIDVVSETVLPTTLSITKQALVDGQPVNSVTIGTAFSYGINITNTGNADAVNLRLIDNMPNGVVVDNIEAPNWNCSNVAQQYTCDYTQMLAAGASVEVFFAVRDNTASNVNDIQNEASVSADNVPSITAVNLINLTSVAIDVNIRQNPDPVVENESFELIVDVINTGSELLEGISVINTLPDGFSYIGNNRGSNCSGTGQVLTCTLGAPVAIGETETVVIPVQAIAEVEDGVTYSNVNRVSGTNFPAVITQTNALSVVAAQAEKVDLSLEKTTSDDNVSVGADFSYSLTVNNNSDVVATGLLLSDNLPEGLMLKSVDANGWDCNNDTSLVCELATLGANQASGVVVNVSATSQVGEIINTALIEAEQFDVNPSNNTDQATVNVSAAMVDLSLSKTASVQSVTSGEQITWTIVVNNNSAQSAANIVIVDDLPEGFTVDSINHDAQTICNSSLGQIDCDVAQLDAQSAVTVSILGTVTLDSGSIENSASVSSSTADPDMLNNSDKAVVEVTPAQQQNADLSVNIIHDTEVIGGNDSTIEINVNNNGPDGALSPDLNIELSGSIDEVSVSQSNEWNCEVNGFNVHCQFNGEQLASGVTSGVSLVVDAKDGVGPGPDPGPGPGPGPGNDVSILINAAVSTSTTDPEFGNNTASSEISVNNNPTEQEILDALNTALAGRSTPQVDRAIQNVSSYCANRYESALEGLCDNLFQVALDGDGETVRNVMEEITPNEVIGQSTSVAEISTAQLQNVGSRLSQLRGGGGGGFSLAGLNARYGSGSLPLGMLAYLNQSEEEADGLTKPSRDFVSPWGFFVNGTISLGERDATGRELGFEFDSYGLTAGLDYRLNSNTVVGMAVGYASFDSDIGDAAKLESSGVTLTGYGSFNVNDNFYVDARISYGKPDFDQSRNINFTLGELEVDRTAIGKTDARQYSVAMSAGYNFYKNSWNITPNASFNYVRTTIDGFTETGAGDFNFIFSEQELESLVWSAGIRVSRAISLKNGVLTPQFDLNYNYESKNDGNDIEARFILAPLDEIFFIETDSPDRTYGSAGLGFVYISSNGKQAYINYRSILGLNGFSRGTFNLGARFEF